MSFHRRLLGLLPPAKRERFAEEIASVFAEQRTRGGRAAVLSLWLREAAGLLAFAARARMSGVRRRLPWPASSSFPGSRLPAEFRWAWRGVRARGWRAAVVVLLLAVVIAATTLQFAVADSVVFRRLGYRDAERLVGFTARAPGDGPLQELSWDPPALIDDLQRRAEIFEDARGYMRGTYTFLIDGEAARRERTAFVVPGLIEMLGRAPAWGRTFTAVDAGRTDVRATMIAERLARARFGSPDRAVGQTLATSEDTLLVVGVMPHGFRFPDSEVTVWRVLDHRRVSDGALYAVARLAPGVSPAEASQALTGLVPALVATRAVPVGGRIEVGPLPGALPADFHRRLLWLLLGASVCLLVVACANVASLELAMAAPRARASAIRLALGASPASLARTAMLEGGCLATAGVALAFALIWAGADAIALWMPNQLVRFATNPIDVDARALAFMAIAGAATWLAGSVPVAVHASRRAVLASIRLEDRTATASRTAERVRQGLTIVEVGAAIVLVAGGALYARTYIALLAVERGFDSTGLITVSLTVPPRGDTAPLGPLSARALDLLRGRRDIVAATRLQANVLDYGSTAAAALESDEGASAPWAVSLSTRVVDRAFFETLRVSLKHGRYFADGESLDSAIITPVTAARLWQTGSPLGRRFRTGPDEPWRTVVGVVDHIRYASESPATPGPWTRFAEIYVPRAPARPAPARPARAAVPPRPRAESPNAPRAGAIFMNTSLIARLDPRANLDEIAGELRRLDPRFVLTLTPIDDAYAASYADRLLAARTMSVYGAVALLVALAGVYAVMTSLVLSRTREIGVRMALGAGAADIRRLVLGSSLSLAVTGAVVGLGGAAAVAQLIESQLYGVSPLDPVTFALVGTTVLLAAIAATWPPARAAMRVDPAITLRSE